MRVLATGTVMVDVMALGLPAVAEPGEVIYTDVETHIGGHPVDVAIDLAQLGKDPASIGAALAIGRGPFGSFVRGVIEPYGIQTFVEDITTTDTGRNIVLSVADEDRRFHLDSGANWELSAGHVAAAIAEFEPDLMTLRPGYSGIDLELAAVLDPLEAGTIVLLDIMQPHPSRPPDYLRPILSRVDIIHCNEREALVNTGRENLDDAVDEFLDAGVSLVLVTGGGHGARARTQELDVSQEAFRVETVDATGCGDAFCAGVILHLEQAAVTNVAGLGADQLGLLLLDAQAAGAAAATAAGCTAGVRRTTRDAILAAQQARVVNTTETIARRRTT